MSTPVKSPLQKKHKGDEEAEDNSDLQITSVIQALPEQGLTLKAFEQLLDKKLDPVHQFLQQIHLDLNAFKASVRQEFENVGLQISSVETQAKEALIRVEQLEKDLATLKVSETTVPKGIDNPRALSAVVGNIPNVSSIEEAKAWLDQHCKSFGVVAPSASDVFSKGPFSNLVFVKCQNEAHRDRLIQSIRDVAKQARQTNQPNSSSSQLFAKIDRALDARTVEGALYAMKKMLISWNFNPTCIKYDLNKGVLSVAGREIVAIKVDNFSLRFEWCDGEWQTWSELHESNEMAEIKGKAEARLEQAKARASNKGKGKGPE